MATRHLNDLKIEEGDLQLKVGSNAAPQSYDKIHIGGDGLASSDAAIYIGNRGDGSGYGYRMYYYGTGSGNNNKLIFKSENLGSPVDMLSFTADGDCTFSGTISTASHGSSTNWKQAYDNHITGIAVTGTSTKTITLTQRDGGTISANFSDQSGSGGINMTNGANNRIVTAVDLDTVNGESGLLFGGSYLEITPGNIATPLHVKRTSASTRQVNLLFSATDSNSSSEGFLGMDSGADLRYGGSSNTSLNSLVLTEDNTDFVVNSSTNSAIIRLAGGGTNFTSFSIGGEGDAVTISNTSSSLTVGLREFIEEKYIYTSNDSNAVYMPMVKGGMYGTSASSVTGQILIKIPSYKTNMMQQFYVDIYEYETGESMTFRVSGYNYNDTNGTWYNTSVVNLSDDTDRDFTVRFGADTTNGFQYVAIGETNSTWSYPQVNVRDFYGGYATSEADTQGSFNVSFVTTTPGSTSQTHTNNYVAGDYNNLKNKPTIPTVNNGQLTVQGTGALGGSGTFTANQSGNTTISISHDDTSSQGSVDNSNGTVIQDVTLDGYGHVTALGSVNLDNRYYQKSESESRYVNVTGDTMTGNLNIGANLSLTGDSRILNLAGGSTTSSQSRVIVGEQGTYGVSFRWNSGSELEFDGFWNSSVTGSRNRDLGSIDVNNRVWYLNNNVTVGGTLTTPNLTIGSGNRIKFANNDYIRFDDTANIFHFDVDGSTSNASVQASTFIGNLSGNATTSTSTSRLTAVDDRDVKPTATGIVSGVKAIKPFFTTFNGMTGSQGGAYLDMIALDTYSDSSAGGPSAITFHKGESVGSPKMYIWKGAWNGSTWGTGQRVFADNYHPNADKWTTARTITLAGDLSGSVSIDGSANVTLTASVNDDSHDLTWANIDGETANAVNSWGGLRHQTNDGYIDFGPANTSHAHIYTDRPNFYFNKELRVNNQQVFHTGYHPNADKWTTARTLTLNGDVTGSVSWDGSGNATLTTAVGNDSHDHTRILERSTITYGASQLQWTDLSGTGGAGTNGNAPGNPFSDWHHHIIMNHANSGGYYVDLAFSFHNDRVHFRRLENGSFGSWREFFHTGHVPTYSELGAMPYSNLTGTPSIPTNYLTNDAFDQGVGLYLTAGSFNAGTDTATTPLVIDEGDFIKTKDGGYLRNLIGKTTGDIIQIGQSGTSLIDQINFLPGNAGNNAVKVNGNTVWNAGNDGAGTGLDADLLDGQQGSYYLDYNNFVNTPTVSGISQSDADTRYINATGDTMGGTLNMAGNTLTLHTSGGSPGLKSYYGTVNVINGSSAGTLYVGTGNANASGSVYATTIGGGSNTKVVYSTSHHRYYVGSSTEEMRLESDGDLHVEGDVTAYSTTVSDIRLKDNVVTIDNALDKVCKLRGVEYTWNKGSRKDTRDLGVIAQEVEKVLPEIVKEKKMPLIDDSDTTYKSVDYEKITAVLVEAVKEQQAQIDELTTILEEVTKQLNNGNNI